MKKKEVRRNRCKCCGDIIKSSAILCTPHIKLRNMLKSMPPSSMKNNFILYLIGTKADYIIDEKEISQTEKIKLRKKYYEDFYKRNPDLRYLEKKYGKKRNKK